MVVVTDDLATPVMTFIRTKSATRATTASIAASPGDGFFLRREPGLEPDLAPDLEPDVELTLTFFAGDGLAATDDAGDGFDDLARC